MKSLKIILFTIINCTMMYSQSINSIITEINNKEYKFKIKDNHILNEFDFRKMNSKISIVKTNLGFRFLKILEDKDVQVFFMINEYTLKKLSKDYVINEEAQIVVYSKIKQLGVILTYGKSHSIGLNNNNEIVIDFFIDKKLVSPKILLINPMLSVIKLCEVYYFDYDLQPNEIPYSSYKVQSIDDPCNLKQFTIDSDFTMESFTNLLDYFINYNRNSKCEFIFDPDIKKLR
jgi:hypothetical protein